ncbi:MAG TPA: ABC transporter permease subunit [Stellaceae bacterium]|nr:ABC transporter permease subunit [Stellaceae bacterium]
MSKALSISSGSPGSNALAPKLPPGAAGLITLAALLALWQAADALGLVSPLIAPAPSDIAASFPALISDEGLLQRFVQTFFEALISAGLAVIVGTPIGWWLHAKRWAGRAYETWVASFAAAPLVLLYPLFLVFFGRNIGTIIVMSFLTALPSVILKTKEGLDSVRRVLIDVGRSLRMPPAKLFWKIMLPASVPTLCTGVRLALVYALISVVGIEFLINFGGLGELIDDLAERWEIPMMYGAISFVVLTSICFFFLTERIERWLMRG